MLLASFTHVEMKQLNIKPLRFLILKLHRQSINQFIKGVFGAVLEHTHAHALTYILLLISERGSTPGLVKKKARLMANWGGRRAHFCVSFPFFSLLFLFSLGGCIVEKLWLQHCVMQQGPQ